MKTWYILQLDTRIDWGVSNTREITTKYIHDVYNLSFCSFAADTLMDF